MGHSRWSLPLLSLAMVSGASTEKQPIMFEEELATVTEAQTVRTRVQPQQQLALQVSLLPYVGLPAILPGPTKLCAGLSASVGGEHISSVTAGLQWQIALIAVAGRTDARDLQSLGRPAHRAVYRQLLRRSKRRAKSNGPILPAVHARVELDTWPMEGEGAGS